MKFVRNGRTQRRELLVASQRGETLDTKSADKLADDPSTLLLGFSYEKQKGSGNVILHYDVEGLWSLQTYLSKRALSVEELMGLLEATERVLDLCSEARLPAEGLLFDPEYIFVDAQCCPRFALIVLDDVPFQARNSPLTLLRAMTAEHVRYATPEATSLAHRVGDLVVELDGVFSINTFCRFVENEQHQGDASTPEARRSVVEPSTGSVWATAGGGMQGVSPTEDGSFFWSPLTSMASEQAPRSEEAAQKKPVASEPVVPKPVASEPAVRMTTPQVEPKGASPLDSLGSGPTLQTVGQGGAIPPNPVVRATREPEQTGMPVASVAAPQPAPAAVTDICLLRPTTGERFALPLGQQVQAGRGSSCAIRLLGNRKLSRIHVALTNTGQMVMVSDVGAVNGVFVNGQRLGSMQSVLVTVGQAIRLADEDFLVVMG